MPKKTRLMMKINDKDDNSLDIDIYEDIEPAGWFSEGSAMTLKNVLNDNKGVKNINVRINSLGGDIFEGIAMYNLLKDNPANVTVKVDGIAASSASIIAMAGDKIIMPSNAMLMIHNCWTYAIGNSAELRKIADDMDKIMESAKNTYLNKCGEKIKKDELDTILDEETYLSAQEALDYGFIDEISNEAADETVVDKIVKDSTCNLESYYCKKKDIKDKFIKNSGSEGKDIKDKTKDIRELFAKII